jgi:exonuclease SbcC
MRILAIRGSNITSLAGPFELRFDEGPLASARLFSITGPTGAGKSSLLDALCLALFNRAPRLGGRRVRVGRSAEAEDEGLTMCDPRSLVRRGAASAFAEVDYQGLNDRRYRARWEARRAYGRTTGKLQTQTITLTELATGQVLGGKQEETLGEIERTLGLSYEQFSRAALLAQGAFAAFLQASGGERAQLLEQMTDTEIYTRLSKGAHERAKNVEDELRALDGAIGAVPMLEPEARAALEQSISPLTAACAERQRAVQVSDAAVRWFGELDRLVESVKDAATKVDLARDAHALAADRREELALAERAQPLRSLVQAIDDCARKRDEEGQSFRQADARAKELTEASRLAEEALSRCRAAREHAIQQLEDAQPELARAGSLDATLREKEQQISQTRAQLQDLERARDEARKTTTQLRAEQAEQERLASETKAWLDERQALSPLEAQWERWQAELARHAEAATSEKAARDAEPALAEAVDRATAARDAAALELETISARAADAKRAWDQIDRQVQESAFSEVDRCAREAAVAKKQALDQLERIATDASALRATRAEDRAKQEAATLEIEKARRVALDAEQAIPITQAELEEAKRALDQLRATLSFEDHRARLEDGAPCPLCGSEEHPYVREGEPVVALFEAQDARVRDREAALRALVQAQAGQRARALGFERDVASLAAREQQADQQLAGLDAAWAKLAPAVRLDAAPPSDAILATLKALRAEHEAELARLRDAEESAHQLSTRARDLNAAWLTIHASMEQAQRASNGARERAHEAIVARAKCSDELARASGEGERARRVLEPAFVGDDGWADRLALDPRAFASGRADDVKAYRASRERRARAEVALNELGGRLASASSTFAERSTIADAQTARLGEQERATQADRDARRVLLGGRGTSELDAELKKAVRERTSEFEAAQIADQTARGAFAAANEARAAAEARAHTALEAARRADEQLRERLLAAGLDSAALAAGLAHDEAWIDAMKGELGRVDERLAEAMSVFGERERARALHEATGRPATERVVASEELDRARADEQAATTELADASARLRQDDDANARRAERAAAAGEARKRATRWRALDELIGSADGKKFRSFAQSLTLDGLLSYANEHLADLTRRYRLMRVPGQEMELQIVDGDMADEIRGTNSLSGGETFLVSLALALALSSLAARDVRIDSLFIDEGFGSLDPATLDAALSALESLQATGRQVGVISHVRALADKIGTQVRVERLGAGRSRVVVSA